MSLDCKACVMLYALVRKGFMLSNVSVFCCTSAYTLLSLLEDFYFYFVLLFLLLELQNTQVS